MEDKLRTLFRLDIGEKDKAYRLLVDDLVAKLDSKGITQLVDHRTSGTFHARLLHLTLCFRYCQY